MNINPISLLKTHKTYCNCSSTSDFSIDFILFTILGIGICNSFASMKMLAVFSKVHSSCFHKFICITNFENIFLQLLLRPIVILQ